MTIDLLKNKAASLPLSPGVYIMKDRSGSVIYVGKAKKLKNRVSQYFLDTAAHSPKTRVMVSRICDFDYIVATTEFEALVLECSLIKKHMPKYNILLKDDKGYPYIRLDMRKDYPKPELANKIQSDGASYFGPFGSRSITQDIIKSIGSALQLPDCSKKLPRDIGKSRPCLNFHMGLCAGWCQPERKKETYRAAIERAARLLGGDFRAVADDLRSKMLFAAQELNFELAASLRDQLNAVEALGKKQLVTAGSAIDTDVIGYADNSLKACFTVLHFRGGNLLDKEYEILSVSESPDTAICSLLKQYYPDRGYCPKRILLPFPVEDADLIAQMLSEKFSKKIMITVPKRGDNAHLTAMAQKNAADELARIITKEEKHFALLSLLADTLGIALPHRIESYDVSNLSGTDIVSAMVVFLDGKPKKSDYKRFKIQGFVSQDDYHCMQQTLKRRFIHYQNKDEGFAKQPDLILIDGGAAHAGAAEAVLKELNLHFPVFGMVKDDRHRTRALITSDAKEISIAANQSLFSFIGSIQEETHRFAIEYHRKLRGKRISRSRLDSIPGIGAKRKELLLKIFRSVKGVEAASLKELEQYLPKDAAASVYHHFHNSEG